MKRLMMAVAVAAMAGGVFADKAEAPAKAEAAAAPAKAEAAAAPKAGRRPALSREQFMARMKERQAERRAKVAELLKGAGVAEDKIPALTEEIEKAFSPRPPRSRRGGKAAGPQGQAPAAK